MSKRNKKSSKSPKSSQEDEWEMLQKKRAGLELKARETEDEKQAVVEAQRIVLDDRFAQLQVEQKALEEEKASMMKEVVLDDDIIHLNIGGEYFSSRRDTLCLCKDSMLASMFSGRWEHSLPKEKDGRIFLDYDPGSFKLILNQLRQMRLTNSSGFPIPSYFQDPLQQQHFFTLAKYLGVVPTETRYVPCFDCNDGVQIYTSRSAQVLTSTSPTFSFVQTPVINLRGSQPIFWKVQITRVTDYLLIGIISNNTMHANTSYQSRSSYGFAISGSSRFDGYERKIDGWSGWKNGDVAILRLDSVSQTLTMKHNRHSQCFEIQIGPIPQGGWRIHVNFQGANNTINVSPINDEDFF